MSSEAAAIADLEKKFVLQNYGRYPLAIARGRGSYLYDFDGKRYLDLLSGIGVNALGHGHPRILKTIREQAGRLIHCSNLYYHEFQGKLAEKIARTSGLERTFFCNSGTEAVECALKMARSHGHSVSEDKFEIVALDNSFHGRTMGAISVTGQPKYRKPFEPLLPGVKYVAPNDTAALEAAVSDRTAGIIVEVIQGEGGIYPMSESFLETARELATRHNAILIFDEIQCGVGRSGKYFAYQSFNPPILPDVMVTAKPLGVGLPIGVVACNERTAPSLAPGMHGSTFGGSALACRVACEFFDILDEMLPAIQSKGERFRAGLTKLAAKHAIIKEVRVFGLMIGVELTIPGKQFVVDAINNGLLINCTHDTVLRFLPPFTISDREIDQAIRILDRILKANPTGAAPQAA